jgi:hypothetical protein
MANLSVATRRKESEYRVVLADHSANDLNSSAGPTPHMFQALVYPLSNHPTHGDYGPDGSVTHRGSHEGNVGPERWLTFADFGNPAATTATHEHGDSISTNAAGVTNGVHSRGSSVNNKLPI